MKLPIMHFSPLFFILMIIIRLVDVCIMVDPFNAADVAVRIQNHQSSDDTRLVHPSSLLILSLDPLFILGM
jgi:hypothetical protein